MEMDNNEVIFEEVITKSEIGDGDMALETESSTSGSGSEDWESFSEEEESERKPIYAPSQNYETLPPEEMGKTEEEWVDEGFPSIQGVNKRWRSILASTQSVNVGDLCLKINHTNRKNLIDSMAVKEEDVSEKATVPEIKPELKDVKGDGDAQKIDSLRVPDTINLEFGGTSYSGKIEIGNNSDKMMTFIILPGYCNTLGIDTDSIKFDKDCGILAPGYTSDIEVTLSTLWGIDSAGGSGTDCLWIHYLFMEKMNEFMDVKEFWKEALKGETSHCCRKLWIQIEEPVPFQDSKIFESFNMVLSVLLCLLLGFLLFFAFG